MVTYNSSLKVSMDVYILGIYSLQLHLRVGFESIWYQFPAASLPSVTMTSPYASLSSCNCIGILRVYFAWNEQCATIIVGGISM